MEVLVCIKRVADPGTKIELTPDGMALDTRKLGFTISPHEECAVEAAVQLIENESGTSTALTLGVPDAEDQLRDAFAVGVDRGILLETEDDQWDSCQTAKAISTAIQNDQSANVPYDLLLFGNESTDNADYQVGIRVATALALPCVTGVKSLEVKEGKAVCKREYGDTWETFEVALPAVVTVKEGLNMPRHPSLRGRMAAKKRKIERIQAEKTAARMKMRTLQHPSNSDKQVEFLGEGADVTPKIIEILKKAEVI